MKIKIGIIVFIVILIVVFALQNTEIVNIKLWFWEVQTPRALLILLCLAVGMFMGFLVPSPTQKVKNIDNEKLKPIK